jgi:maintenance of morphology protein 1
MLRGRRPGARTRPPCTPSLTPVMGINYLLSFEPTFTQGLILGQLSILFLLTLILRHLFFDSRAGRHLETPTYHPRLEREASAHVKDVLNREEKILPDNGNESAEWFNLILQNVGVRLARIACAEVLTMAKVLEAYRCKLRNDLQGSEGDEVARRRIEELANKLRPVALLVRLSVALQTGLRILTKAQDPIKVHAVDLGESSPRLFNARQKEGQNSDSPLVRFILCLHTARLMRNSTAGGI